MYQNHNSTDASFLELLTTNPQSNPQNLSRVENHQNLQYQELSLSLGMQITSSMDLPSFQYNYLNPHLQDSSGHGSRSNKMENIDYLSFDRAVNNQIPSGVVARIYSSRYLKPSQELLEEVANLHEAIKQLKMNKRNNFQKIGVDRYDENGSRIDFQSVPLESATSSSGELSASEKQDLQNKIVKLFSLLDEVHSFIRIHIFPLFPCLLIICVTWILNSEILKRFREQKVNKRVTLIYFSSI